MRVSIGGWVARGGVVAAVLALAAGPARAGTPAGAPKAPEAGRPADSPIIVYKGKVVDEAGKPVSGIFPMTFKLYAGATSKKAIWSDFAWVAVDRGIYTLHVGDHKPLPPREDLSKLVLGVEIRGIGEVVREPFVSSKAAVAQATPPEKAGGTGPAKPGSGVKYADAAGYAVEADHAKTADRLGNFTLEDVTRKIAEDMGGGGGGGRTKVKIGTDRRFGNRQGGTGGTEYNEVCPKGYVMVGIKGGAAVYLDSIQIVCAPLE
jgi:hypothetical protein